MGLTSQSTHLSHFREDLLSQPLDWSKTHKTELNYKQEKRKKLNNHSRNYKKTCKNYSNETNAWFRGLLGHPARPTVQLGLAQGLWDSGSA